MSDDSSLAGSSSSSATIAYPEPDSERWHGTSSGYIYHKCRGPRCTAANTEHVADYRRRRMARTGERIINGRFVPAKAAETADQAATS
jgi:hypothetical protein